MLLSSPSKPNCLISEEKIPSGTNSTYPNFPDRSPGKVRSCTPPSCVIESDLVRSGKSRYSPATHRPDVDALHVDSCRLPNEVTRWSGLYFRRKRIGVLAVCLACSVY
jgi:hypothetical protein